MSGLKGVIVGATDEVFESSVVTARAAAIAGFVDGAITSVANGGNLGDAVVQGISVATQDASAAYAGAKLGNAAGAALAVTASTIVQKAPDAVEGLQSGAKNLGEKANRTLDKVLENVIGGPPGQKGDEDYD